MVHFFKLSMGFYVFILFDQSTYSLLTGNWCFWDQKIGNRFIRISCESKNIVGWVWVHINVTSYWKPTAGIAKTLISNDADIQVYIKFNRFEYSCNLIKIQKMTSFSVHPFLWKVFSRISTSEMREQISGNYDCNNHFIVDTIILLASSRLSARQPMNNLMLVMYRILISAN